MGCVWYMILIKVTAEQMGLGGEQVKDSLREGEIGRTN